MGVKMKRWHEDVNHCRRQKRLHDRTVDLNMPLGRYRKQHAMDCGHVRCGICHGHKYPVRELHEHEVLADLDFREQLREFWV